MDSQKLKKSKNKSKKSKDFPCYESIEKAQRLNIEGNEQASPPGSSKEFNVRDTPNKDLLINPDCPIGIIREYVSSVAGLKDMEFEFANDKARIFRTSDAPPSICGLEYFKIRDLYYIVVRKPSDGVSINSVNSLSESRYTPLLNPYSKECIEFCVYQKKRSSVISRKSVASARGSKDNETLRSSLSGRKTVSKSANAKF